MWTSDVDLVADAQRRQRGGCFDCVQQMAAGVDRLGQRVQGVVKLAVGDRVKQQTVGVCGRRRN